MVASRHGARVRCLGLVLAGTFLPVLPAIAGPALSHQVRMAIKSTATNNRRRPTSPASSSS